MTEQSPVERIKRDSRLLRGTLAESLADPLTGAIREDDTVAHQVPRQLPAGRPRRPRGAAPAEARARLQLHDPHAAAGRRLHAAAVARARRDRAPLRQRHAAADHAPGVPVPRRDQDRAQGDDGGDQRGADRHHRRLRRRQPQRAGERQPGRVARARRRVYEWAKRLSEHLLPRTRAYHEIWLDGEKVAGTEEVEPIYGPTYLPRKFKAAIAVPPVNDVDVFAHDLGFIAIVEDGELQGFNVTVGGGLGTTHGDARDLSAARRRRRLPDARAVARGRRGRASRPSATSATARSASTRGSSTRSTTAGSTGSSPRSRAARALRSSRRGRSSSRRPATASAGSKGFDGRWHLTLRIEAGRVADTATGAKLTGLREIAKVHRGDFRLTPNQNLIIANVEPSERAVHRRAGGALRARRARAQRRRCARDALACVALPTCPLAMAEAERYLPRVRRSGRAAAGGARPRAAQPLVLRITGCPNGCARPYLAEVALSARRRAATTCTSAATGAASGSTCCTCENVDEPTILAALDAAFARFAAERAAGGALRRLRVARGPRRRRQRAREAQHEGAGLGPGRRGARAGAARRGQRRARAHATPPSGSAGRSSTCRAGTR